MSTATLIIVPKPVALAESHQSTVGLRSREAGAAVNHERVSALSCLEVIEQDAFGYLPVL